MRNLIFIFIVSAFIAVPSIAEEKNAASFSTFTVRGQSMSGLLSPGDEIIVDRTYYASHPILRDDIVTVTKQYFPAVSLLDLYLKDWKGVVPNDNFLVFGTHVRGTRDSSVFGPVTRVMITGKVVEKKVLK